MISLYEGTPGSGKSLHTAKDIIWRLKHKRITIGNFTINRDAVKKRKGVFLTVENWRLTPERLMDFSRRLSSHYGRRLREGEILLIIDESQLLFNSRDYNAKERRSWLSFFTQHRKFGYDVILVAQFDRMLDRQVRCLIEYEFIHRKVSNFGFIGTILGFLFGGNLFVSIQQWYPIHEKVDSGFFMGSKSMFRLYDSYNEFSGFNDKPTRKVVPLPARETGVGGPVEAAEKGAATSV